MSPADTFAATRFGSAADSRLHGITQALTKSYDPPLEAAFPERLTVLVARLKASETRAADRK